jgi:inhibitor of cysteine peptidase
MELTLDDDGSRRTVLVGDEVVVKLPEKPTTGYRWRLDVITDGLRLTDDHYEATTNPRGAPSVHVLRFRAVRDGAAMLRVVEGRSWEDHTVRAFSVDLDVRA